MLNMQSFLWRPTLVVPQLKPSLIVIEGEEAKNPQRDIPLAVVISLLVIFLSYFGISTVVTLMEPYFNQDDAAPLAVVFQNVGFGPISIVISVGAIFALCTSLLGSMFPMPRMLYAMAGDGLLFRIFADINSTTRTPLIATIISGLVSGIMGAVFELSQLINMMSIGTLLAYSIVALCVLILRYRDPKPALYEQEPIIKEKATLGQSLGQVVNFNRVSTPDKGTTKIAEIAISIFIVLTFITTLWLASFESELVNTDSWQSAVFYLLLSLTCLPVIVITLQPQNVPNLFFKVPLIPFTPCISIFINVYLMMKLDVQTWIRFCVWLFLGGLIYLFYSIPNSVEGKRLKKLKEEMPVGMH